MSDERDPFEKVMDDANVLHEVAMENVPPDLKKAAEDFVDAILRKAKARPLTALAIAGGVGFLIAAATSR